MQVLIYEYLTGGGCLQDRIPPSDALAREGGAMLAAVAADFALLAEVEPVVMLDARRSPFPLAGCSAVAIESAEQDQQVFAELAARVDWTLIIAPETGDALFQRAELAESVGGRLLSQPSATIELTANKQRTLELLAASGVPTPHGEILTLESRPRIVDAGFPLVAKPIGECGSSGLRLIEDYGSLAELPVDGTLRVEQFAAGRPASVAVLCGGAGDFPLPACTQQLSQDGRFAYLGGAFPLESSLNLRAQRLALRAVQTLQPRSGYLGIDLVLGSNPDGSRDVVIEVNPRLTTSYVGLRAGSRRNLAAAMLAVCSGDSPQLDFADEPLEFTSAGQVRKREPVT